MSSSEPSRLTHIAVIMDGNGRWAKRRGLARSEGHREGLAAARRLVENAAAAGVAHLTLFAFSNENWQRPSEEVSALMRLFADAIASEGALLRKNGIRLRFMGDTQRFSASLRAGMSGLEKLTEKGARMTLTLALGYSGKWDIVQAAQRMAAAGEEYSEESFARYLASAGAPPPDLLIRTGGEQRISNFMLWQAAYTEFYFTSVLWPDFSEADLSAAIADFHNRERRYGRVGECAGEQGKRAAGGDDHAG